LSLNYVTLTGKIPGGTPASFVQFTPSAWVQDPSDSQSIPPVPEGVFLTAAGTFSVPLLATDNVGVTPATWYWTVEISGVPGVPYTSWSFNLLHATGATQDISTLTAITPTPQ
jgi:hypothetical protein